MTTCLVWSQNGAPTANFALSDNNLCMGECLEILIQPVQMLKAGLGILELVQHRRVIRVKIQVLYVFLTPEHILYN
jgi:hypothetical protein